ncbi:TPA: conjugative transfer ATPase [Vibrio vulnificus]|nr:conjugative transfer ATPase [Vibrio vulnificus]
MGNMNTWVKKLTQEITRLLHPNEQKDETLVTHKLSDREALYQEAPAFSDFFPYAEWLHESNTMLFDDLVSVGCGWIVEMASTEAKPEEVLEKTEEAAFSVLNSIQQDYLSDGQYVLSAYLRDDISLAQDFEEIERSIHPAWRGTALADAYLESMKNMFSGLESEKGLFNEGSESSLRPFRGGRRMPRLFLYRRVGTTMRDGKESRRKRELQSLKEIRQTLEDALSGLGIKLVQMKEADFYEFMVRWLNPMPASTDGDINRLLKENPCPDPELSKINGELCMSLLYNTPETRKKEGVIIFDDCPSRFLQVDRISKVPIIAALTGERESEETKGEYSTNFDKLPNGAMFVKHIVFAAQDEIKDRVDYVGSKSEFNDDAAEIVNEQIQDIKKVMASGGTLFKVEMGFYVTAKTQERLDEQSRRVISFASNKLGLGVIAPKHNLFPIESYIRNMPFIYDPCLDARRKRGRGAWLQHSVSLLPLMGRKRGKNHHKDKICMTTFNRGGERLNIDPLNKASNAHMVLLGPTGTGKSATLNKTIVELLIFHNARLIIAEAGASFDPLMDFLEAEGADVQRVNINAGKTGRPIAPFASARLARDRALSEMNQEGIPLEEVVERVLQNLSDERNGKSVRETVEKVLSKDTPVAMLEKDYLGESVMIAKIMVTGGDIKEERSFRRRDELHLGKAIIDAVYIADERGEDLVRPEHVLKALRDRAGDLSLNLDENMRVRLTEMADNMEMYCEAGTVRSQVLNRHADGFKKCDCLHVELGVAQRDGYEDLLALAYLGLLNNVNDIAERKELEGDDRPIYVITDEAHLILKHPMIAPIAIKIVRMWRKYGAWFLPATQDTTSFKNGAEAILVICEMFLCLAPPEDEIEALTALLKLTEEEQAMIRSAKMVEKTYTEGVFLNRSRKSSTLFRLLQPSFTLAVAGTDDAEKQERGGYMRKHNIRQAGAVMMQTANLDYYRGIITKEERDRVFEKIAQEPKYQQTA